MKGVINFVKKLSMTKKKRSSEILERIEGNFFKIFCLKINLPKIFVPPIFVTQIFAPPNICDPNFCSPNIYDKSTPVNVWRLRLRDFIQRLSKKIYRQVWYGQNGIYYTFV